MAESQRLREAIFHSIEQTSNDLRVQQDATNFDFRKRHYEMKRAKEELEYQMKTTKQEIADQEENIRAMEWQSMLKKIPSNWLRHVWRTELTDPMSSSAGMIHKRV
eukprot:TRINITY_DN36206_c0_g1_i1.p1 TRINITY_DN36206_c0_g1~~TRINITY_DN36206_c0_g1_i1.p1  ORF type:complete len:118 (+),score=28.97 TRINITY_DN36206_c0_g1_i1:39-356(+)